MNRDKRIWECGCRYYDGEYCRCRYCEGERAKFANAMIIFFAIIAIIITIVAWIGGV